ncbi:MAG: hypothetical protein JW749_01140 [Sedimentisphaerales bacterium]|nr:hypothetical protein [Sedimentisphaerales bacterium]
MAVAAGEYHSLGLKQNGSIVIWGHPGAGSVPEPNTDFTAISVNRAHSLGLKSDGSIVAWGNNDIGQCNIPEPNTGFVAVAAGGYFSLAIVRRCDYELSGDLNADCIVDFYDFAKMASNWLIDCYAEPDNPQCVPK